MERKNKLVLFLLIVLVMGVAMFSGFGLTLFGGSEVEIVLPTPIPSGSGTGEGPGESGWVEDVRVTPETVQNVIATLARPENYSRTVTVEMAAGEDRTGTYTASVLVDGAWTSVWLDHDAYRSVGEQRTILYLDPETGEGTLYRWYGTGGEVVSWPVERGEDDLAQHIPTYEDVLELDPDSIVDAGFVVRDGVPCVYVEAQVEELGYLERYWVSTENGLLIAAETSEDGVVVLRMSSTEAEVLQTADEERFTLPDGTVLHRQGE